MNAGTLNLGGTAAGTAGSAQTFTIIGSDLSAGIVLTAPTGVQLSDNGGSSYSTTLGLSEIDGTVGTTTIDVRISAGASVGWLSGDITASSAGATTQDVSVTGTVVSSPAGTTAAVTPSTETVSYGQSTIYTATVSSPAGTPSDGSVQFFVNGIAYGSPVPLSGGAGQIQISVPVGSYTITAEYTGDTNYAATLPAGETPAALEVSQAAPSVTISPVDIVYGTALANTQLSGTATSTVGGKVLTVPGSFRYTNAAGTVLVRTPSTE